MDPLKMAASLRVRRFRRLVVAGEYSEAAAGRDQAAARSRWFIPGFGSDRRVSVTAPQDRPQAEGSSLEPECRVLLPSTR